MDTAPEPSVDRQHVEHIDPTTLTPKQIREAVIFHSTKLGSHAYYIADEIGRIENYPAGLVIFQWVNADGTREPMRAYWRDPKEASPRRPEPHPPLRP